VGKKSQGSDTIRPKATTRIGTKKQNAVQLAKALLRDAKSEERNSKARGGKTKK